MKWDKLLSVLAVAFGALIFADLLSTLMWFIGSLSNIGLIVLLVLLCVMAFGAIFATIFLKLTDNLCFKCDYIYVVTIGVAVFMALFVGGLIGFLSTALYEFDADGTVSITPDDISDFGTGLSVANRDAFGYYLGPNGAQPSPNTSHWGTQFRRCGKHSTCMTCSAPISFHPNTNLLNGTERIAFWIGCRYQGTRLNRDCTTESSGCVADWRRAGIISEGINVKSSHAAARGGDLVEESALTSSIFFSNSVQEPVYLIGGDIEGAEKTARNIFIGVMVGINIWYLLVISILIFFFREIFEGSSSISLWKSSSSTSGFSSSTRKKLKNNKNTKAKHFPDPMANAVNEDDSLSSISSMSGPAVSVNIGTKVVKESELEYDAANDIGSPYDE